MTSTANSNFPKQSNAKEARKAPTTSDKQAPDGSPMSFKHADDNQETKYQGPISPEFGKGLMFFGNYGGESERNRVKQNEGFASPLFKSSGMQGAFACLRADHLFPRRG